MLPEQPKKPMTYKEFIKITMCHLLICFVVQLIWLITLTIFVAIATYLLDTVIDGPALVFASCAPTTAGFIIFYLMSLPVNLSELIKFKNL